MKKQECRICGTKIGFWKSVKVPIIGKVCIDCYEKEIMPRIGKVR